MESVLDETRTIKSVYWHPDGAFTVGVCGVTKIEAYREAGQGGYVPWFAVWKGDDLLQRVNGAVVAGVEYAPNAELSFKKGTKDERNEL